MNELYCDRESISAYADRELPGEANRNLEEHLKKCPDCNGYLHQIHDLTESIQGISKPAADSGLTARIMELIRVETLKSRITLVGLLETWSVLSLLASVTLIFILQEVFHLLLLMGRELNIIISLLGRLALRQPLTLSNVVISIILLAVSMIAFYGFNRVYTGVEDKGGEVS
jgi:predicted anti-sigma-YlaC factor YlaD